MTEKEIKDKFYVLKGKKLSDKDGKLCEYDRFLINKKDITVYYKYGFHKDEIQYEVSFENIDVHIDLFTIRETNVSILKPTPTQMAEVTENNLKGLRTHLFNAIRQLEGGTMNNEQGKAMAQIAQVIINSAKLEMEFKRQTDDKRPVSLLNE